MPLVRNASKLPWVLALTLVFFVVELVAAGYASSNALRADGVDDIAASNPSARAVPLMHALALTRPTALRVPAARGLDLHIDIEVPA